MKKRLAIFGLTIVFVLSALWGGIFAPLVSGIVARASDPTPENGILVGNYRVSKLPRKNYLVGDEIATNGPEVDGNVVYGIYRTVSNRDYLVAVGPYDKFPDSFESGFYNEVRVKDYSSVDGRTNLTYRYAGSYVYKFFSDKDALHSGGEVYYSYIVNVSTSTYTLELPSNSYDILPNVTVPGRAITMPLPSSLYDLKGRDLLDLEDAENYEQFKAVYIPQIISENPGFDDDDASDEIDRIRDEEGLEALKDYIYRDMQITCYGNSDVVVLDDILNDREFTPLIDGGIYYAEYSYKSFSKVTASYRTANIVVEKPSGADASDIDSKIQFEPVPSMSFTPSSSNFKLGQEASLPVPTVNISTDKDISKISLSSTSVSNFTFVTVRYRDVNAGETAYKYMTSATDTNKNQLLPVSGNESNKYLLRITDFKFTPLWVGEYRFTYYTTTVFGHGKKFTSSSSELEYVPFSADDFPYAGNYLRYYPFAENVLIDRDSVAPTIKWTAPYEYKADTTGLNEQNLIVLDGDESKDESSKYTLFEDAPDYKQYLPGTSSNSKTVIKVGESLELPALIGDDNATASKNLEYQLYLYRYNENGVRDAEAIYWKSGRTSYYPTGTSEWRHERGFEIDFSDIDSSGLFSASSQLRGFAGQEIAGTYDLLVRAYDGTPGISGTNVSGQYYYTFKVVAAGTNTASRPKIQSGSFSLGQTEYYEGDTVRFNVANPTDTFTDDKNIEVKYYLSVSDNNGKFGKEFDDGKADDVEITEEIKSGVVSFNINRDVDNKIGRYLLDKLEKNPTGEGYLSFRIYAVARNYYALINGININSDSQEGASDKFYSLENCVKGYVSTESNVVNYVSAVYASATLYDLSYGEAAMIELTGSGTDLLNGWYDTDVKLMQDEPIYIPEMTFYYPTAGSGQSATDTYMSDITFEVVQPSGKSITTSYMAGELDNKYQQGGDWRGPLGRQGQPNQVVFGDLDGTFVAGTNEKKLDNRRYFISSEVGVHHVIVSVKNSGGNVSIFVGQVVLSGNTHYTSRFVGGTSSMKVGQKFPLPKLELNINGRIYETSGVKEDKGFIVTSDEFTKDNVEEVGGDGTYAGVEGQLKVGSFTLRYSSRDNSKVNIEQGSFAPISPDKYIITYVVEITDDYYVKADGDSDGNPDVAPIINTIDGPMTKEFTYEINVENDTFTDLMVLELDDAYGELASSSSVISVKDGGFDTLPDGSKANKYNFFTPMLSGGAAQSGDPMPMSDVQLYDAMEPVAGANYSVWQYGKVYIPNYLTYLDTEVQALVSDYANKTKTSSYITVEFTPSDAQTVSDTFLLDTRDPLLSDQFLDGKSSFAANDVNLGEYDYYWFRPQGKLQALDTHGGALSATNAAEAYANVQKGAENRQNWASVGDLKVDGGYIITYVVEYEGFEVRLEYTIAIGDTQKPSIAFVEDVADEILDKTWYVGDTLVFSTDDLEIKQNGGKTQFTAEYLDKPGKLTVTVLRNDFRISQDDDEYRIIKNNDGYYAHYVNLRETGTYTITFRVKSASGNAGEKTYRITVTEKTTKQISPEEVWGTILIILSSGLLLGVIIYFIRTGQSTKFSSAKVKAKKSAAKDKTDTDVV